MTEDKKKDKENPKGNSISYRGKFISFEHIFKELNNHPSVKRLMKNLADK